jgi:mannose-6-phosphate isomerase-like protein (cupin superfamily)
MVSPSVVHDPEFLRALGGAPRPGYKLDPGRRTGPGEVELHDHETDIMHVVQGRATVVTGEDEHTLREGDVLVIPSGVPHQFVDITGPFLYFVTKVQS